MLRKIAKLAISSIYLVTKTESIFLDHNYTGKLMSAFIGGIRSVNLNPDKPALFIHSSELPQTFIFASQFGNWQPK